MENKKALLSDFERIAQENGYEVFGSEEIASYLKDGLKKSLANELTESDREIFVSDILGLQKAVLSDDKGNDVIRYYRKEQVKWETAADGTVLKGVAGVYLDTPTNRRLKRVGEAYVPNDEIVKAILNDEESAICKAVRTGRYADTSENRRLHRVGQLYTKKDSGEEKPDSEKTENKRLKLFKDTNMIAVKDLRPKYKAKLDKVIKEEGDSEMGKKLTNLKKRIDEIASIKIDDRTKEQQSKLIDYIDLVEEQLEYID